MLLPATHEIVAQVCKIANAQPDELTVFHSDQRGAIVFDRVTNDFCVYAATRQGFEFEGARTLLSEALDVLARCRQRRAKMEVAA